MSARFDRALDDVLSSWQAGERLADCLARYPEYASRLRPLLTAAQSAAETLQPVESPSREALERGRRRFLEQAAARRARRRAPVWAGRPAFRAVATGLLACLLLLAAGCGLVVAAGDSLPGNALYPVKRWAEDARLWATQSAAARERLRAEFARERQEEVDALRRAGEVATVEFEGELSRYDRVAGSWTVGGLPVLVTDDTRIDGEPRVGRTVWVRAQVTSDGRLLALWLRVTALPGTQTPEATPPPSPAPSATRTPGRTLAPSMTPIPFRGPATASTTRQASPPPPTHTEVPPVTSTPEPGPLKPTPVPSGPAGPPHTPGPTTTAPVGPSHTPGPPQTPPAGPSHTPGPPQTPPAGPSHTPGPPETPNPTRTPRRNGQP